MKKNASVLENGTLLRSAGVSGSALSWHSHHLRMN